MRAVRRACRVAGVVDDATQSSAWQIGLVKTSSLEGPSRSWQSNPLIETYVNAGRSASGTTSKAHDCIQGTDSWTLHTLAGLDFYYVETLGAKKIIESHPFL